MDKPQLLRGVACKLVLDVIQNGNISVEVKGELASPVNDTLLFNALSPGSLQSIALGWGSHTPPLVH